ncbi:MAG: FAD-dependent oxidoreductase, partial [Clostridia bacterium]|nr:FAD-dependent oxidoreductase [Clostridia bacterium]
MQYVRQLEIKYNVDVFVAGGGAAGVAAAVAAARLGKKVFLAESSGCLGG